MKKSELRNIIREEIQNVLKETRSVGKLNESIDPEAASLLFAILAATTSAATLAIRAGAGDAIASGIRNIKNMWARYKDKKQMQPIIDRLKNDKDIKVFLSLPAAKQRGKWRKLINSKLKDSEKSYLNRITKTPFQPDISNDDLDSMYDDVMSKV